LLGDCFGNVIHIVFHCKVIFYTGNACEQKQISIIFHRHSLKIGEDINFSFSGIKTAVLYDLVRKDAYDLATGPITKNITEELRREVSSSLLVCVGDIFCTNVVRALSKYPQAKGLAFVGGVACNQYLRDRLSVVCDKTKKHFWVSAPAFCTDNGAMIAFVGGYKAEKKQFSSLDLDVQRM